MSPGILIVDDYAPNLIALEAALETLGHKIVRARSGEEALRLLDTQVFDLIVLDVQMPGLGGMKTAELARQRSGSEHIPIIFMSATTTDMAAVLRGYSLGAVDFLVKPVDADVLRAKVAAQLDLHRRRESRTMAALHANTKAERRRLYAALMQAPAAIAITREPQHIFEFVNDRFREFVAGRDALGRRAAELLSEFAGGRLLSAFDDVFRSGDPFIATELELRDPAAAEGTNEARFFNVTLQSIRDSTGAIEGVLIHGFEVTTQVRARHKEHAAVVLREEFLSIASHELRTPVTTLQLELQRMLRIAPDLPAQVAKSIEKAFRQTERLGRLIGGLLDVSRITSGTMRLEREEVDFAEIVRGVSERHRAEAETSYCELSIETVSVIGCWDRMRVDQVVTNLLMNAFKYGAGKPVSVSLSGDQAFARLAIIDHGIGILPQDRSRIFERFERAVPATSYGGLGLGLYIALRIVQAHGGDIRVDSEIGKGSTFVVTLPLERQSPPD
ncbi:MAG TPA: ATP-binding protein [Myxococcales bacterium]